MSPVQIFRPEFFHIFCTLYNEKIIFPILNIFKGFFKNRLKMIVLLEKQLRKKLHFYYFLHDFG